MIKFLKTLFKKEDNGVASIEFALILPLMALLLVGMFEISWFMYCHNKMNRTAQDISNVVARGTLTLLQLQSILQASALISQPFNFSTYGNVIVTAVSQSVSPVPNVVLWRQSWPGGSGGSLIAGSSMPSGMTVGQVVLFTEVFYTYQPVLVSSYFSITNKNVYALAVSVPRQGQITTTVY
jgi:Flp pilus assembly protein TadG